MRDEELPGERLQLVLAEPRVGEAHPEHEERDDHDLGEEHDRAEEVGRVPPCDAGDRPAAEEQRGGDARRTRTRCRTRR